MSDPLVLTREELLVRLGLNRPAKGNALSRDPWGAPAEAFEDDSADPSVGAILLEAKGPGGVGRPLAVETL
ncbi:MAG: hypothetical protein JSU00_07595 [Acidobacteria bacterium]|nr:hypothetical protein [Acidobacteriota bacterium]